MYAPMEECRAACIDSLTKYGLTVIQFPISEDERAGVETILTHSTGQFISNEYTIKAKQSPQELGSLITYLRRYSYMAVLGLAPEDDDGLSAMPKKQASNTDLNKATYDLSKKSPLFGKPYSEIDTETLKQAWDFWGKQETKGAQKTKVEVLKQVLDKR